MLANYLKITIRNLLRNPGYSMINIGGLAVGLACCFLIAAYIHHETGFDRFHERGEEIYRVIPVGSQGGVEMPQTWNPSALAGDLLELPEVEQAVRLSFQGSGNLLTHEGQLVGDGKGVILADSSFFEMFSYPLLIGDPASVLDRPGEVVISRTLSSNHFGGENPVGKILRYDEQFDFVITGVMENMPSNSHLQADVIVSFTSLQMLAAGYVPEGFDVLDNYGSWNYSTYVTIPGRPIDADRVTRINLFLDERRGLDPGTGTFRLQPLHEIHFEEGIKADTASGDLNVIYAFSGIALFLLVIACFNFVNLTTARSVRRAREVGVRKSLGADRHQLVRQFLGESLIIGLAASGLALLLMELAAPVFSTVTGSGMELQWTGESSLWIWLLLIGAGTSLAAALYPAFYLSTFNPIQALKNQASGSSRNTMRRVLTGLQFAIAAFLIIGTLTIQEQLQFVRQYDPGFEAEQVVFMNPPQHLVQGNYFAFRDRLLQHSFVEDVSRSNRMPGMVNAHRTFHIQTGDSVVGRALNNFTVDPDFLSLLDLEITEGRNFSWDRESDLVNGFMLNESAVRFLGLENPVGAAMRVGGSEEMGRVVGVVKDFHYNSLHRTIEPLVFWYAPGESWTVGVRVDSRNMEENLAAIGTVWSEFAPAHPFSYQFLDDFYGQQYRNDRNFSSLVTGFSLVGILIACLGLLGLSAHMVEQRMREIGIRKVLGATVRNIATMFSADFLRLVMVAFLAVIPVAWLVADQWLRNFAFRIDQSADIYLLSAGFLAALALLTTGWQAIRAALTNPVEVLKNE